MPLLVRIRQPVGQSTACAPKCMNTRAQLKLFSFQIWHRLHWATYWKLMLTDIKQVVQTYTTTSCWCGERGEVKPVYYFSARAKVWRVREEMTVVSPCKRHVGKSAYNISLPSSTGKCSGVSHTKHTVTMTYVFIELGYLCVFFLASVL